MTTTNNFTLSVASKEIFLQLNFDNIVIFVVKYLTKCVQDFLGERRQYGCSLFALFTAKFFVRHVSSWIFSAVAYDLNEDDQYYGGAIL